jgi:hypothetical protein
VGVYTSATGNVVSSTLWSGGAWSAPSPILATAVAREQPYADATSGAVTHVLYQGTNFQFYYLALQGSTWSAAAQSAGGNYGPVPATIAARGANATAGFLDGQSSPVNEAAQADLDGGVWQPRVDVGGAVNYPTGTPIPTAQIIPLSSGTGPELMMVYVLPPDDSAGDQPIVFSTRTAGTWLTPAPIAGCTTHNNVALAPLPSGGAILAFWGQNGNPYWTQYAGGNWSPVAAVPLPPPPPTGVTALSAPPAVTHGIGGDVAEIAYVWTNTTTTGGSIISSTAYHSRLSGSTWSTPVVVTSGTTLNGVAIASAP